MNNIDIMLHLYSENLYEYLHRMSYNDFLLLQKNFILKIFLREGISWVGNDTIPQLWCASVL